MASFSGQTWALTVAAVTLTALWVRGIISSRRRVSIKGRRVVITGCDSGFGLGTVAELAKLGAEVIALCHTAEGCDKAVQAGAKHALRVDLSKEAEVAAACGQIKKLAEGDLFALIHNAGTVTAGMIDFQPLSNYRRCLEVNFFAPVTITQQLLPLLKDKTADGAKKRVVIVSSVDGIVSLPANAPYDASKFAVEAYADALRTEQSFWNISVSVVNPATMRTPLALGFFESEKTTWRQMSSQDSTSSEPPRWKEEWPEDWLEQHTKINGEGLQQIAQDPAIVIADLMHAVTAEEPKFRYLSGTFAKTLFYFLWVAPESWAFAIKRATINPPPRVRAPPADQPQPAPGTR